MNCEIRENNERVYKGHVRVELTKSEARKLITSLIDQLSNEDSPERAEFQDGGARFLWVEVRR